MNRTRSIRTAALGVALVAAASVSTALAGPADASSVPSCTGSQLTVGHTGSEGATGHGSFQLEFRNRSNHTCSLYGYPGFDLVTNSDKLVEHARRTFEGFTGGESDHKLHTIDVRPGHYASADVEWEDIHGSGACRTAPRYAFTPAGTSKTVYRNGPLPVCSLEVHPTVYGRSGTHN